MRNGSACGDPRFSPTLASRKNTVSARDDVASELEIKLQPKSTNGRNRPRCSRD